MSYVGAAPKPRLVHLSITPNGEETFSVAGARHRATLFVVKAEIGGIAGMIAPLIGKQPADAKVWVVGEGAPAFVSLTRAVVIRQPPLRSAPPQNAEDISTNATESHPEQRGNSLDIRGLPKRKEAAGKSGYEAAACSSAMAVPARARTASSIACLASLIAVPAGNVSRLPTRATTGAGCERLVPGGRMRPAPSM